LDAIVRPIDEEDLTRAIHPHALRLVELRGLRRGSYPPKSRIRALPYGVAPDAASPVIPNPPAPA
jgi:hypothetical protein